MRSSVRTAESRELTERIVVTTVEKTADATDAGTTTAEIITAVKINRNGENQNRNDNRGGDNGNKSENRRDNNRGDRRRDRTVRTR